MGIDVPSCLYSYSIINDTWTFPSQTCPVFDYHAIMGYVNVLLQTEYVAYACPLWCCS